MINDTVNGETAVYGVIGNPIHHTFSPCIQNTCADIFNKNIIYTPFLVKEENIEEAIKGAYGLNIRGLNVTVPHKKSVMKCLWDIDKRAEAIGAVNTLKYTENGYKGYNTDIIGIEYSLKLKNIEIKDKAVVIVGAGGSACAAGVLVASSEAKKLTIANRTLENAQKLCDHIKKYYKKIEINAISIDELENIDSCDIIFNTTTVGFGDKQGKSPIQKKLFKEKSIKAAFDVIYTPWETKFLKDARTEGVIAINGFDMLIYQAVAAQEIWFDEKYDMDKIKELRNYLEKYYREIN